MMADRDTRRLIKQAERDRRIDAIYRQAPEVKRLDEALAEAGKDGLLRVWEGGDVEAVKARLALLQERKRDALQAIGFDERVYDVVWDCPICQDRGFTRPGEPCVCMKQGEDIRAAEFSLSSLQRTQTFESFSLKWYDHPSEVDRLLERVKAYSRAVASGEASGNLFLFGPVGSGKTHLCSAVANVVIAAGKTVIYTRADEILDALREDIYGRADIPRGDYADSDSGQGGPGKGQLHHRLVRADLLILEDLGAERLSDFAEEQLIRLVDQRINWQKPWIITSQLVGDKFTGRYDPRLVDRVLGEGQRLHLNEGSIRYKKAQQET